MPADDTHARRIHDEVAAIARQNAYVRDIIAAVVRDPETPKAGHVPGPQDLRAVSARA